ncbi:MAG TPA: acetyl-CoA C-acyltransferase [Salinisphaeraceae bacterium]|nr:acetyl-CoA C-acyltransferase [Salinisphaeraceae bacterium]
MQDDPIVITGAARTPIGAFNGALASLTAPQLGAAALGAAMAQSGLDGKQIDEVLMGQVLPAGVGQAPARQAAFAAGIAQATPCVGLSKVCGSGMKALITGHDSLLAGSNGIVLAGGMESMTNAPYLLPKARNGYRLGHGKLIDHMFFDGLEDHYEHQGRLMGTFAEDCAAHYSFSRSAQDDFALESYRRARAATENGQFAAEITSVEVKTRRETKQVARDESPFAVDTARIPELKPAFRDDGTVTAANASSISDGAAALALMRRSQAEALGATQRAVIRGHSGHAQDPAWFTTAPIGAINKLLQRLGWHRADVDLFEINEAFAVVVMAAMQELDISHDRINVYGGACALGHPIGASGARLVVTLLNAMEQHDCKRGIATLCIGGGEATAVALERV